MTFQKGNKMRLGMKNNSKQKEAVRKYMKNRVVSEITKLKISNALKGKKRPEKIGIKFPYKPRPSMQGRMVGEKNPAWKGGKQSFDRIERVRFGRTIQKLVFERDGYKCVLCSSGGDLQVDHIQSWSEYVDLRFSMDNCRTLCVKCHYQITFGKSMPDDVKGWGHNLIRREIP